MLTEAWYLIYQVHIHYGGEGEIVEVAGSFNGWHSRIKMDAQPSSNPVDSFDSKFSVFSSFIWFPKTFLQTSLQVNDIII